MQGTHEDERHVQLSVVHLDELSVIFLRFMVVLLVELDPVIFLGWRQALLPTARGFNVQRYFEGARLNLPIRCWLPTLPPIAALHFLPRILTTVG